MLGILSAILHPIPGVSLNPIPGVSQINQPLSELKCWPGRLRITGCQHFSL